MKKKIITILLALTALVSNAQRCKLIVDKKDALTNDALKETNYVFIGNKFGSFNTIRFSKKNDDTYIYNQFHVWGFIDDVVTEKQEFILKLADGSIIKFYAIQNFEGKRNGSGGQAYTQWDIKCKISKEDLLKISKSNPVAISTLPFSLGKGDALEIKKEGKDISKGAECILQ